MEYVAVSRFDPFVVVRNSVNDFECEFLVKIDGLLVARLYVQIDLLHLPLLRRFDGELQQLAPYKS